MRRRSLRLYTDDYDCYHPGNMQSRYLTSSGRSAHHITTVYAAEPPDPAHVLRNLGLIDFVGVADFYRASVCLLALSLPTDNGFRPAAHVDGCR